MLGINLNDGYSSLNYYTASNIEIININKDVKIEEKKRAVCLLDK